MNKKLILITLASSMYAFQSISTKHVLKNLDNPNYIFIDTRDDSFYNGFKQNGALRGGHIKNAIQLSTASLEFIHPNKFESFMKSKGISKDKILVFYDSHVDALEQISAEFEARDYKVKIYKDIISYLNNPKNPIQKFKNFHLSISPKWLHNALKGEKVQSYDGRKIMVFEVSWGDLKKAKEYKTHIKGAYHFNTDWIENGPVWNLSKPEVIEKNLLKAGITKDKMVVLYSQNQMAALRVFWALKWAGVEDVRFLNGGLYAWQEANLPTENTINTPKIEKKFGIKIPANPQLNISMPNDVIALQKKGLKLVSNRAWREFNGEISGYTYIKRIGEPKGAIWGLAGHTSADIADFYDPDGTLRNPNEIASLWQNLNINKNDKIAFYCGTGWRGAVSWFITELLGWKHTYLYDGGWNAWQMDKSLPIQTKAPKNIKKIDTKNDYGKVFKAKASCKS